jgi:hypothetical protein
MTKHLVPTTALVAYAAAKRRAAQRAEAEAWRRQLFLEAYDIRCPGLYQQRLLHTAQADDED